MNPVSLQLDLNKRFQLQDITIDFKVCILGVAVGDRRGSRGHTGLESGAAQGSCLPGLGDTLSLYRSGSRDNGGTCTVPVLAMQWLCICCFSAPHPPPIQLIQLCQVPILLGSVTCCAVGVLGVLCSNNFAHEMEFSEQPRNGPSA